MLNVRLSYLLFASLSHTVRLHCSFELNRDQSYAIRTVQSFISVDIKFWCFS